VPLAKPATTPLISKPALLAAWPCLAGHGLVFAAQPATHVFLYQQWMYAH